MHRTPLRLLVLSRPDFATASIHTNRQVGGPHWTPPGRYHRKTPPRREDVPLFEISGRVLDLDAEDNSSVRPYDKETDSDEAEEKWRHAYDSADALVERMERFHEDLMRAEKRMRSVASTETTPWRVTDHDIWSVALLGSSEVRTAAKAMEEETEPSSAESTGNEAPRTTTLARVLYENGILGCSANDTDKTFEFLLHRQRLSTETAKIPKENGHRAERAWDTALVSCTSLAVTRRLLAHACRSVAGRAALVRNDRVLADRLLTYLPFAAGPGKEVAEETTPATSMAAANTISAMLLNASCSSVLGPLVCAVGLQAAAATGEPAAVQRFLGMGAPSERTEAAVLSVLTISLAQLRGKQNAGTLNGSRADVLQLLTGVTGLRAALMSTHTNNNSSLAAVPPSARNAYLAAIAELGSVHTLWEEQHAPGAPAGLVGDDVLVTAVLRYAELAQAQTDTRSTAAPFSTLRPAPWIPSTTQPPPHTDVAFRADVVRAFSEETPAACVAAVDRLLARHGRLQPPIMA